MKKAPQLHPPPFFLNQNNRARDQVQTQLAYILFKSLLLEYGASNVPTSERAKERHTDLPPEWLTTQGTGLRKSYCTSECRKATVFLIQTQFPVGLVFFFLFSFLFWTGSL